MKKEHPEFIYAGVQRGDDLAEHYASADLLVFPSITETFGNVTLEGMASGLAVVAYDYAAARQHIISGHNGFSVPFNDEEAFVAAVVDAAKSDLTDLRAEARSSARKVRWKKVVRRFEKQLKNMSMGDAPGFDSEFLEVPTAHSAYS